MRVLASILPAALVSLLLCQPLSAQTITQASGTFAVSLKITANTAVPSGGQIWCHVRVLAPGNSPNFYADGNVQATPGSGSTYTCKLTLPFNWSGGVGSETNPTVFVMDALIVNAAIANAAVIAADVAVVRHGYAIALGPEIKQGANGTVTLATQLFSL